MHVVNGYESVRQIRQQCVADQRPSAYVEVMHIRAQEEQCQGSYRRDAQQPGPTPIIAPGRKILSRSRSGGHHDHSEESYHRHRDSQMYGH